MLAMVASRASNVRESGTDGLTVKVAFGVFHEGLPPLQSGKTFLTAVTIYFLAFCDILVAPCPDGFELVEGTFCGVTANRVSVVQFTSDGSESCFQRERVRDRWLDGEGSILWLL